MNDTTISASAARTADTRQRLLDAARERVKVSGLAGATSREITTAAGANLAAITYHFGSKDELVAEALFGELERRVQPALTAFDGDGSPSELMLGVVQQLLAEFEQSKDDAVVFFDALLLGARDPKYRDRALALYAALRSRLSGVVADLVDDGVIPTWVDADAMASLVLAVANGIALQTIIDPHGPDQVAMASQFAGLLVASANAS